MPSVSFCAAKEIARREPPALCGLNWIGIELELEKIDRERDILVDRQIEST
jgi:hypothetical protein